MIDTLDPEELETLDTLYDLSEEIDALAEEFEELPDHARFYGRVCGNCGHCSRIGMFRYCDLKQDNIYDPADDCESWTPQ